MYHLLFMALAMNCFDHFEEGVFMYLTTTWPNVKSDLLRRCEKLYKNYFSDAGAEMAAVYLSAVSTAKLAGQSVWRSLRDFFEDMVGKKHLSLLSLSTTHKKSNKKIRKMVKNWPGDGSSICYVLDL